MLIEQEGILHTFYQVLVKLRSRALSNYLGIFSDFVVVEFKVSAKTSIKFDLSAEKI